MFKYVSIDFPNSAIKPSYAYALTLHQNRYQHEVVQILFRDWDVPYEAVSTGSLITFDLYDGVNRKKFKGYVHKVTFNGTPSLNMTEVIAVSASYVMKNQSQKVYRNMSADGIIEQIARKHRFNSFTASHPRIYPQVSQAGHTDWELMVRLAKQSGYSLRTDNTEIYFQPLLEEYKNMRESAPTFVMRDASNPKGSTIYSFVPGISESIDYEGDVKAAISVSGFDTNSKSLVAITKQKRDKRTKRKAKSEFFDKFSTNVVATNPDIARHEAEAADRRAAFPYRATAVVLGNALLRPDMPVYMKGVGDYSGYWVVLGAEHKVIEQQRNIFMYTTTLHLGTDSLGEAVPWEDGRDIKSPTEYSKRKLIPGVRQTNTPPNTMIMNTAPYIGPQSEGTFSQATNRAPETANDRITNAARWVAAAPTPLKITEPVAKKQAFPNRILSKVVPKI